MRREGRFLILGHDNVGRKVAEFLRDAGESVTIVDSEPSEGVDYAGDPFSPDLLHRAGIAEAQAVILASGSDSATLFAAAVVRNVAPEVIIIASTRRQENVARIHRAGADFALAVGQVAGQLLAYHLLGQHSVSLESEIKLVAAATGSLAGRPLRTQSIRERVGCSVVAVERGSDIIVELGEAFDVHLDDIIYLTGTNDMIAEFHKAYPGTRSSNIKRRGSWLADGVEEVDPAE